MVIHLAGPDVQVAHHLRQRCAWCGALLLDYPLDRTVGMVELAPDGSSVGGNRPATWQQGALIARDGNAQWVVPYPDPRAPLPPDCCAMLPPEVTARADRVD